MNKKRISGLLLMLCLCLAFTVHTARADFGDFGGDSDYDYGGYDYDYDDSSYDYDYDYDYDDYDYDYDYDYSTGGYSSWDSWDSYDSGSYSGGSYDSGSSYSSGSDSWYTSSDSYPSSGFASGLIVFIIIVVILWIALRKGHHTPRQTSGYTHTPKATLVPASAARYQSQTALNAGLNALRVRDPEFNEADFLDDASNLYVRLQHAWTAKDLEPVRPALSDSFFAQMERQLQQHINNHTTNYVEKIAVLSTDIIGCEQDETYDILTVWVNARIIDYTLDDASGKLVGGSRSVEKFMTYQWQFIRPKTHRTAAGGAGVDSQHCPNCGAPVDMNQSAVCEYCGATLKASDHDWILNSIKGIRQQSAR